MGDCQSLMPMRLDENIQICAGGLSIDGLNFCLILLLSFFLHFDFVTRNFFNFRAFIFITDACRGDSGGPFMQVPDNLAEPKYFLTGIEHEVYKKYRFYLYDDVLFQFQVLCQWVLHSVESDWVYIPK